MNNCTGVIQDSSGCGFKGVLGVVVPAFNEARWIRQLLDRVLSQAEVGEVVVVDDGSSDDTWNLIKALPARDRRIVVFRHPRNQGKGSAVRTGLAAVHSRFVVIQDADLEYDPNSYRMLLEPAVSGEADVVYGSRFLNSAGRKYSFHTIGNRALTAASNFLTGLNLTDEATCYKLFRKDVLDRLILVEKGFEFCPEVTAKIAKLGIRIVEVPVSYQARSKAEGKKIRMIDGLHALVALWKHSRSKDAGHAWSDEQVNVSIGRSGDGSRG